MMSAVYAYLSWIPDTLNAPYLFKNTCRWTSHVGRGNVFPAVWVLMNCIVIRMPNAPCEEHAMLLLPHRFERCRPMSSDRRLYTVYASQRHWKSHNRALVQMNSVQANSYLLTRRLSARITGMEHCKGHLILSVSTLLVPTAMMMDLCHGGIHKSSHKRHLEFVP